MAEVSLNAVKRESVGKGSARQARAAGNVPGVLYGRGMDPVAIEVNRRELLTAFHTDAGMNVLFDLKLDGGTTLAMAKELQRDPVKGTVVHADFIQVDRSQEVEVDIPIHVIGDSAGVKEGGVLEQPLHEVQVRCKVTDVPESIEADITNLAIGDSLRVSDLAEGREFHILNDQDAIVALVAAPISEEQLEAMVAATETVAEEGAEAPEEGAEAPAGEAPAEAAAEESPGEAPAE